MWERDGVSVFHWARCVLALGCMQIKDSGKLKSSDQRKIRQAINDQYPLLVSLGRRCCAAPPPRR